MILIQLKTDKVPLAKTKQRLAEIPGKVRKGIDEWGSEYLTSMMYRSAIEEGINEVRGIRGLYGGVHWDKLQETNTGILTIINSAAMLDSMNPHWVNIRRDRETLLNWALQSGNDVIESKAREIAEGHRDKFAIYVKPHPFIKRGYRNAIRIFPEVLRANLLKQSI